VLFTIIIEYGMLILFGVGVYICYIARIRGGHLLHNYGFWSFGLYFISALMNIVHQLLLNTLLEQNMTPLEMPIWVTGLNIIRGLLILAAFIVITIGFYRSFKKEKQIN
jgi:hypothetical protein